MNKKIEYKKIDEIASIVAAHAGTTQKTAKAVIRAYADAVMEAAIEGKKVQFGTLGSFVPHVCESRPYYDMFRKEKGMTEPTLTVKFKVGKSVRNAMSEASGVRDTE